MVSFITVILDKIKFYGEGSSTSSRMSCSYCTSLHPVLVERAATAVAVVVILVIVRVIL